IAAGRGWSFEQTGWSVQLHTIADAEIAGELSRRLTDPATFGPMLDTERSILDVLNQMPNVAAERDGGVDHAYESPAFRYVVRTRTVENVRRVAWARGAVRRNDLEWTVLEARPSNASSAIESLGVLLPSPPATKRIAARLDRHGAIACEFLRSPGRLADLVDYWRAHDVATTPSSTGSQGVQELQCRFQGRSFQVAALSESQTLGTTLMIVALDPPSVTSSSALPSAP
ncbi:MAG: hypothetical protein K8U03_15960, partial [Planctomycetia bacterium]|nr:hypothetical protein [Planctomycetia bacterium]